MCSDLRYLSRVAGSLSGWWWQWQTGQQSHTRYGHCRMTAALRSVGRGSNVSDSVPEEEGAGLNQSRWSKNEGSPRTRGLLAPLNLLTVPPNRSPEAKERGKGPGSCGLWGCASLWLYQVSTYSLLPYPDTVALTHHPHSILTFSPVANSCLLLPQLSFSLTTVVDTLCISPSIYRRPVTQIRLLVTAKIQFACHQAPIPNHPSITPSLLHIIKYRRHEQSSIIINGHVPPQPDLR